MVLAAMAMCVMASAVAQDYQLITSATKWRYSHQNLDFGTAWRAPAYDDTVAGWEGPGSILFGYETTPAEYSGPPAPIPPQTFKTMFVSPLTEVPFVTNYYFRTHFTVPNIAPNLMAIASLRTTNYIDDGCIYYINGVEIFRYNMPAGPVNAATWALGALTEGYSPILNETIIIRTNPIPANLIIGGDNVFAVELHNTTNTSSDEVFGMVMTLAIPEPIVIVTQPVGETNYLGSPNYTLSVAVTGTGPSYQWYSNNVRIAGAIFATNLVSTAQTNAGVNYYVVITNFLGKVTSDVARVSITTDKFPIQLLQAFAGPPAPPGAAGSNQVLVYFNKTIERDFAATNPGNYRVTVFGMTNVLQITLAQLAGNTVRLSTSSPFIRGTNYVLTVYDVTGTNLLAMVPNPGQIGISTISTNPPPIWTNLMTMSQGWTWNENNGNDSTGNSLGTSWLSAGYSEDNSWAAGNGIFYFSNLGFSPACTGGAGSTISQGVNAYYFRTTFDFPAGLPHSGNLRIRHFVDDGAIFYLNGTEISRYNMAAGPVSYATFASRNIGGPMCISNVIPIGNLLVTGLNHFQAEDHQSSTSPDPEVYFGMELDYTTNFTVLATNTSPVPPRVSIVEQSPTTEVISWATSQGGLNWGLEFNTDLKSTGWTILPNSSPYTNTVGPVRKFFRAVRK